MHVIRSQRTCTCTCACTTLIIIIKENRFRDIIFGYDHIVEYNISSYWNKEHNRSNDHDINNPFEEWYNSPRNKALLIVESWYTTYWYVVNVCIFICFIVIMEVLILMCMCMMCMRKKGCNCSICKYFVRLPVLLLLL